MSWYFLLKCVHILSSSVLLGTGAGNAFFFVSAQRTGNPVIIAAVARGVVNADFLFMLTAVILQPLSGVFLAIGAGYPLSAPWLAWSMALYVFVGCCWLPVVWLQIRMRGMATAAAASGGPLPAEYHRCYRWWFALGWPAFAGLLAIFSLMVAKPGL